MNIVMFLANYCNDSGLLPIISLAKNVVNLIRFAVPVILIVMGSLDLAKAVISSKDDEMKKAQGLLIKRLIYAVAVFLVVTIVQLTMSLVADSTSDKSSKSWISCWNKA